MKPPALYRSPVFWLGAFVLLFLVWAWADSMKTGTGFGQQVRFYRTPTSMTWSFDDEVIFSQGGISFSRTRVTKLDPRLTMRRMAYEFRRYSLKAGTGWFPMPSWVSKPVSKGGEIISLQVVLQRVVLPVWLIVVIYLVCWCGVMMWSRRRWWRLAGGSPELNTAA